MRIAIDARGIRSGMTGVGHYTRRLVDALCVNRPEDTFVLLTLCGQDTTLRPPHAARAAHVEWIEVEADPESHPAGDWWYHRLLPDLLDGLGADLFHGPAFAVPAAGFPWFGKPPRAALVTTLHDLSVCTMPEAYSLKFRWFLQRTISLSVAHADVVLCPTEFGCREAQALFPDEPREKFVATPLAHADLFAQDAGSESTDLPASFDLPEAFLLMVGTFETRKNPGFFLDFFNSWKKRGGPTMPLVWCGEPGHRASHHLKMLDPLRQTGEFRLIEGVGQEALAQLYRAATALLYPSYSEGFGLPLVEAMASGLPVLAADTTCLPEVVGEGGTVLPLDEPDRWVEAACALRDDPEGHRQARERALARAQDFSWQKTATATAQAYAQAVQGRTGNSSALG